MEKDKKILIVAGEASGDLHASTLVSAIKQIRPHTQFFGLGGKKLEQEGVKLYCNIVELAVVGFFEVLKNLAKFHKIFNGLLEEVDKTKPDLAILVDYPGFNLRLAAELKKRNIPIIYYISPQIWAWGAGRIKTIKTLISRMIVVFQFEEELYNEAGVPVSFVGHPLIDTVKTTLTKEAFQKKFSLDAKKLTVALLPGSREKEVNNLLPIMLDTAKLINKELNNIQFVILRSSTVKERIFQEIIEKYNLPIRLISEATYDGIAASDFAIVASGTATLETGILATPMVIVYKVSLPTWLLIRPIIKIPYIGLVNVVMQHQVVKEFIQFDANPKKISEYIIYTLSDQQKINELRTELSKVKPLLGEKGSTSKAANIIVKSLDENQLR